MALSKDDLKLELDLIAEQRVKNLAAGARARGRNPVKFAAGNHGGGVAMARWIAVRLDGTRTVHVSRAALARARRRATGERVIVDSWPESAPPPVTRDAAEWDAYRTRRGYAGGV